MGSFFSAPKTPAPVAVPDKSNAELSAEALAERKRRQGAAGRGGTILSGTGVADAAATTAKSTLLGG